MSYDLHIGEISSLALSVIGIYLNLKDRDKTYILSHAKIPRVFSLELAILFAGTALVAVIVIKLNEILVLMMCSILYFVIENKTLESTSKHSETIIKGLTHTIKIWPILFVTGVLSSIFFEGFEAQQNVQKLQNGDYSELGIIILTACIIAPITEELIFRGMIYPLLKKGIGIFLGCVISSLIFSAIHYNILSFATLFVFSCSLTYVYEKYNTLLIPIISHSIFNGIMIILILLSDLK